MSREPLPGFGSVPKHPDQTDSTPTILTRFSEGHGSACAPVIDRTVRPRGPGGATPQSVGSRVEDPTTCSEEAAIRRAFPGWPRERRQLLASQLAKRGTRFVTADDTDFPITEEIPGRPALLFIEGDRPEALRAPRVAVVGTRAASVHGLTDAWELGAFLGAAGVSVVSGMAIGIDGAAHHGALQAAEAAREWAGVGDAGDSEGSSWAGPIGVLATGLDVVYPRRHLALFERVRRYGVLLGEQPFGTPPDRGRFPVRNRIIAALADVVCIVEATLRGGSRITAERALDYGRPVLVVPGSRRNPAAAGCNALLADGAQPLLDPTDVLVALGLTPGGQKLWSTAPRPDNGRPASRNAAAVLKALAGESAHPDQLTIRTGLDPGQVALAVEELVALGRATRDRGFVWST
jgi:DNA processing protein